MTIEEVQGTYKGLQSMILVVELFSLISSYIRKLSKAPIFELS
jgi:hypothetical protein